MSLDRNKQLLEVALQLHERGMQSVAISKITIDENGKKKFFCITNWKNRTKPFTKEEIIKDFSDPKTENIAVRTGKISNLIVIDIDNGADQEFLQKYISKHRDTVLVQTQSNGWHLWLRCNGLKIKNTRSKLASNLDTRAEDGIAITPPSIVEYPDGTVKEYKWKNHFSDTLILEPDAELEGLLLKTSKNSKDSTEDSGFKSPAEVLLDLVTKDSNNYELFHDEQKASYVRINNSDHFEIWKINSKNFNHYLSALYYNATNTPINAESKNNVLSVLSAKAVFEGKMYKLNNRVAEHEGAFWYDLANDKWQVVKITESGSEVVDNPPIIFQKYSHQLPQPLPISGVELSNYLKFFNIKNEINEILLLCWILSCFIPDIPHPALYLYGIQGAAKSTCQRLLKRLIDHSSIDLSVLISDKAEIAQLLSHHWLINFDNVSEMSDEISDTLCRAISGYAFSKRELYSDDNDVILKIKRCIGINGINMVAIRPDLLERSIIIELEPILSSKRYSEKEVLERFDAEKAAFLGACFDVISKAMKIKKDLKLDNKPRMSDFFEWGYCFTQAMGYKPEVFIDAYTHNLKTQYLESIYSDWVMKLLYEFINERLSWEGTSEDLNSELFKLACNNGLIEYKREWKVTPNSLGKKLNRYKPAFEQLDISIDKLHTHSKRIISIIKKILR